MKKKSQVIEYVQADEKKKICLKGPLLYLMTSNSQSTYKSLKKIKITEKFETFFVIQFSE